jgi:putative membrane protein
MMHDWYDGWGWHGMGFGWIFPILVIAIVVGVVALVARRSGDVGPRPEDTSHASAREILDQRLARGEIDEQEYKAKRKLLDG